MNNNIPNTPAGFWLRFLAFLIDIIILVILSIFINFYAPPSLNIFLLTLVICAIYFILFECSSFQATLGKAITNLIVVNDNFQKITFKHSLRRFFSSIILFITLGIGFIIVAFSSKKESLQDKISNSRVIKGNIIGSKRRIISWIFLIVAILILIYGETIGRNRTKPYAVKSIVNNLDQHGGRLLVENNFAGISGIYLNYTSTTDLLEAFSRIPQTKINMEFQFTYPTSHNNTYLTRLGYNDVIIEYLMEFNSGIIKAVMIKYQYNNDELLNNKFNELLEKRYFQLGSSNMKILEKYGINSWDINTIYSYALFIITSDSGQRMLIEEFNEKK